MRTYWWEWNECLPFFPGCFVVWHGSPCVCPCIGIHHPPLATRDCPSSSMSYWSEFCSSHSTRFRKIIIQFKGRWLKYGPTKSLTREMHKFPDSHIYLYRQGYAHLCIYRAIHIYDNINHTLETSQRICCWSTLTKVSKHSRMGDRCKIWCQNFRHYDSIPDTPYQGYQKA